VAEHDTTTQAPPAQRPRRRVGRIISWALFGLAVAALIVSIAIPVVTTRVYSVSTTTMENTVLPGDQVYVAPGTGVRRGDVVVLHVPVRVSHTNDLFVKRVIGLPGDHVACCNARGQVTVNGKPLDEGYIYPGDPPSRVRFSVTLGKGQIWVMGDRRTISLDSREWGPVPVSGVAGRVIVVGHGFSFTWLHTPRTFVADGLAPADRRADSYLAAGLVAGASALALLVMAVIGIARAVIRAWRSRKVPPSPADPSLPG
jgi:signal peptidase I